MSRASHVAAFAAGCAVAAAVGARAAPDPRPEATRYRTLDTFAQALTYVNSQYVEPVDEKKLLYAATRGMLESLDPYSSFFSPAEYKRLREDTEGEFPGVGLVLGPGGPDDALPDAQGWPIVDEVLPESPAAAAGIAADDRILSIDGVATVGDDARDERYWDARLRGDAGTKVVVEYLRPGRPAAIATLTRRQVKIPSVDKDRLGPGIGYLGVRRFQEATAGDVTAALAELRRRGADQVVVLDLRKDSGGLVDQAIAVADLFLDGGRIVTIRGRGPEVETHDARKGGPGAAPRLIVLVNGQTASAAEILAGALQDHKRATVLGTRTYGKGAIQTYFDLADGSGLKLTTHRYLTPDGHEVEGHGIAPDLEVAEFESELVVPGAGSGGDAGGGGDAGDGGSDPGDRDILGARGADDHQLRIAYQTAQRWLGSK
jgi:carboxyl-terminal processing protease